MGRAVTLLGAAMLIAKPHLPCIGDCQSLEGSKSDLEDQTQTIKYYFD